MPIPRHHAESDAAWIERVASTVVAAHPRSSLADEVSEDDASIWSKEGAELARTRAYPDDLARESKPSSSYEQSTLEISQRQIALAGYRIAARLNALLE